MAKQMAVIGLGRFGSSLAKALYDLNHEVLGIDESQEKVEQNIDHLTHAVRGDSTDETVLKSLGIHNFDVVVVAIGQDVHASILTTLILKELGVKYIVVKAQNERHGKVVSKIGADKVVFPERDMGIRLAHNLISPNTLDFIELSENYSIAEVVMSDRLVGEGKTLKDLAIRARFGCNVIAIRSGKQVNVSPRADDSVFQGDVMVVIGTNEDLKDFEEKA